jgi:hypothetical protein
MSDGMESLPNMPPSKLTLEEAIKNARSMELKDNIYGIENSGSELQDNGYIKNDDNAVTTKVLNNEEWGAILILANSIYGKSNNPNYFDEKSNMYTRIYPNLTNKFTGCSSNYNVNTTTFLTTPVESCTAYNDYTNATHISNGIKYSIGPIGLGASTTGTVYGVYDMAGGEREMVATVTLNKDGELPIEKYPNYVTTYSNNSYIGFINSLTNIDNLYHYKLGDGIREYYRSLSDNGLWNNGYINQQTDCGVFLRGGYYKLGKGASIYSVDISDIKEMYAYHTTIVVE